MLDVETVELVIRVLHASAAGCLAFGVFKLGWIIRGIWREIGLKFERAEPGDR